MGKERTEKPAQAAQAECGLRGRSDGVARSWALLYQEQIQGPENAPIARFDGLGCYEIRSGFPSLACLKARPGRPGGMAAGV